MWVRIARSYPEKRFYSYTKVEHIFDFSALKGLPNANIISSFINGKLNFGPIEYVKKLERLFARTPWALTFTVRVRDLHQTVAGGIRISRFYYGQEGGAGEEGCAEQSER
jgi:hypothetical protein